MAMTLRLNKEEEQALNAIKDKLGCGTASATLKKMILEHALVAKQLADTQARERQATDELRTIRAGSASTTSTRKINCEHWQNRH